MPTFMRLELIDWIIIAAYFAVSLGIGLYYKNRARRSIADFFLAGRSMPWFVAGISMVATTFAADTPLAVNELVVQHGISGNWLWWNMLFGGMLTTFFFARLWRRAGVVTEVELIEFRYGGKPAAFLRGFKAIYLGVFMNSLVLGWVNLAMMTILSLFFDLHGHELWYVAGAMLVTALYSSVSGLWGVAVTDMVQFVIAMTGCIVLAVVVVGSAQIGGITGLKEKVSASALSFFPRISSGPSAGVGAAASTLTVSVGAFLAYLSIWWSSWYPGAEPGGGGYVAQRMMSTKDERGSVFATLLFQVCHYCVRPWPWILVGLCSVWLYSFDRTTVDPQLPRQVIALKAKGVEQEKLGAQIAGYDAAYTGDSQFRRAVDFSYSPRKGYIFAMLDFLPAGLRGLLLVAFLAAYMSTVSSQLNWGTSYIVNDCYVRFFRPSESFPDEAAAQKHYIKISRVFTLIAMAISLFVTTRINSISGVWGFLIECGAGLGLVLILRWYWWRINAWAEIAATVTPFIAYACARFLLKLPTLDEGSAASFFFTVGVTTFVWMLVMFLTAPESPATLDRFFERVKPDGWWNPVAVRSTMDRPASNIGGLLVCWASSVAMTYSALFLMGSIIFQEWQGAGVWAAALVVAVLVLRYFVGRTRILA